MKKIVQYHSMSLLLLFVLAFSLTSCSKQDDITTTYVGENKIHLITKTTILKNNGDDELVIEVLLVKKVDQPVQLTFGLLDNQENGVDILELVNPTITFAAGEKKALLTVKSKTARTIDEAKLVRLDLIENSSTIPLLKALDIQVLPLTALEELTPEQIALLDGYKAKGLDLYPLIGELEVKSDVHYPGGSYLEAFTTAYSITVRGKTVITLSELATEDQPVLKMVANPMGLDAYFYQMFRDMTIDDLIFWNSDSPDAPPANKTVMELANLTRTSSESFEVTLNHIAIDIDTKEISFISTLQDFYGNDYEAVPFEFNYSAWNRFKKLMDEGNVLAIENYEMGGSINPAEKINVEDILSDEYGNDTWRETKAKWNGNTLTFDFVFIHSESDGYIRVNTEYKLK